MGDGVAVAEPVGVHQLGGGPGGGNKSGQNNLDNMVKYWFYLSNLRKKIQKLHTLLKICNKNSTFASFSRNNHNIDK